MVLQIIQIFDPFSKDLRSNQFLKNSNNFLSVYTMGCFLEIMF